MRDCCFARNRRAQELPRCGHRICHTADRVKVREETRVSSTAYNSSHRSFQATGSRSPEEGRYSNVRATQGERAGRQSGSQVRKRASEERVLGEVRWWESAKWVFARWRVVEADPSVDYAIPRSGGGLRRVLLSSVAAASRELTASVSFLRDRVTQTSGRRLPKWPRAKEEVIRVSWDLLLDRGPRSPRDTPITRGVYSRRWWRRGDVLDRISRGRNRNNGG